PDGLVEPEAFLVHEDVGRDAPEQRLRIHDVLALRRRVLGVHERGALAAGFENAGPLRRLELRNDQRRREKDFHSPDASRGDVPGQELSARVAKYDATGTQLAGI